MREFLRKLLVAGLSLVFPVISQSQTWQQYDSLRHYYLASVKYDSALFYAEKTLLAVKEQYGENDTLYATMAGGMLLSYYYLGDNENAIKYGLIEKNLRQKLQGKKSPEYAGALANLALMYNNTGKYSKAEPLFEESLRIYKETDGVVSMTYGNVLANLTLIYVNTGDFARAEKANIEVLNIWEELVGEKHPYYTTALNILAFLYQEMGNYVKARILNEKVVEIRREILGENHPMYAGAICNLALIYSQLGDHEKAEPLYLEALKIRKEVLGEKHYLYASSLNNLALHYCNSKQYDRAEPLYVEAIAVVKEVLGEKHFTYARYMISLAALYTKTGEFSKAEALYIEGQKVTKEALGAHHPDYGYSLIGIATFYEGVGRLNEAEPLFLECIAIANENIARNFSFMSEKEKEMYFQTVSKYFKGFNTFALKRSKSNPAITTEVYNNAIRNKGLLLKSSTAMRNEILNSGETLLLTKYDQWLALKTEISKQYSLPQKKQATDLKQKEEMANEIEKELVTHSASMSDMKRVGSLSWKDVQKALKPGEAAVEFVHFRYTAGHSFYFSDTILYCALIVKPSSKFPEMIPLFPEKDLIAILGKTGDNGYEYITGIYGENQKNRTELYNLIWKPLEECVGDAKTVYISPDGLLHKVSFAALSSKQNVYLCDKYNIQMKSSTGLLANSAVGGAGDGSMIPDGKLLITLFGGINYNTDSTAVELWNYLEGTKTEVEKIAGILIKPDVSVNYFTGISASESQLALLAPKSQILHLSTHGFFFPDPDLMEKDSAGDNMIVAELFRSTTRGFGVNTFINNQNPLMRSGLALSGANDVWGKQEKGDSVADDGVLTAQEVALIDMRNTRLTVLSACETGLGDIRGSEGVYGLQRGFKMAGVQFLIMSLWQVPDAETVEFMTSFYTRLLKTRDIRKSFAGSQAEMRKKYDPFFWAAFVLVE
ncbi:MAG: CHAT domain-containing protein [Bacteroidetes bacterium]|nr:CHAT domain-containing protein [Bacteroidota bacterium]